MEITPEMLGIVRTRATVKKSNNQVKIAEIQKQCAEIEAFHEEEMAKIRAEERITLEEIKTSNEQEISKIKAKFALEYKKLDDDKQLKLAQIFEKMFNAQIRKQNEKDIALANQAIQGLLSLADKYEKTHEKNLEFYQSQIDKYDKKIEATTGYDKTDARRKRDDWSDKVDIENKNFAKQQDSLNKSITEITQSFSTGALLLPDLVTTISNINTPLGKSLGFNQIPEISLLENNHEEI